MKSENVYITTTLPYVNANPHVGHVMEFIKADFLARYYRINYQIENGHKIDSYFSENVFFNTGTDEHGLKIYQKALENNQDPQEFVDEKSKTFSSLKESLNISYDRFIRTTDPDHVKAAQDFWKKCDEAGYIYKKNYEGLYCVGCELFVKEKDLVNGECPFHPGRKPELISEENYFFKYSALAEKLLDLYKNNPNFVIPESRHKEITSLVAQGLEDFSISRLKTKMPWGIDVPNDSDQVMYVWFDALVNYISTLGWPHDTEKFEKFWNGAKVIQICGKDNLQFQAARWQAMLLSVGIKNTDHLLVNGFILSDGQKMSKTIGNVVDPMEYVEKYGAEALRYFTIRELHPYEDSDFTEEKFIEGYNANLANGLGNVVSRVLKMAENNEIKIDQELLISKTKEIWQGEKDFHQSVADFSLQKAADSLWAIIARIDQKITETEPFKLIKTDKDAATKIVEELVWEIWKLGILLEPLLPVTALKIRNAVIAGEKPESLFARI